MKNRQDGMMKGTKSDREALRARVKDALGGRTQKELEQTLGVSGGTLSRVFGGRRNVDAEFLEGLAEALDVEVRRLLHGTDFLLLFDEAELPDEPGEVDVVAPLPPPPADGPPPVASLPSRAGADGTPDAPNRQDPDSDVAIAERDTEPTMPVVDLPNLSEPAETEAKAEEPAPPPEPEPEAAGEDEEPDDRTVTVNEPVRPTEPPPRGIGGRIRRFLASLFGG